VRTGRFRKKEFNKRKGKCNNKRISTDEWIEMPFKYTTREHVKENEESKN
jgi:hypothetical protein